MKHTRTYSHHENRSHTSNLFTLLSGAVLAAVLVFAGCANPASPTGLSGGSWSVTQDGGVDGTQNTASLFFMFGEDPGALTADEITLGGADTDTGLAAASGPLTGTGKNRTLPVLVTVQGSITVSITKAGLDPAPVSVTVYKNGAHTGITWAVEARGHVLEGTTCVYPTNEVRITFSAPVDSLTAAEIFLNSSLEDPADCIQGVPRSNADKTVWTLPIAYIPTLGVSARLPVRIEKAGIQSKIAYTDFYQVDARNSFTAAPVGGVYGTTATQAIDLAFTRPLRAPLSISDIVIFNNEEAAAVLGASVTSLDSGAGRAWRVSLNGVDGHGNIGVWVRAEGVGRTRYTSAMGAITGFDPVQVPVVSDVEDITFTAEANGRSGETNTTVLTLVFASPVSPLPEVRVTAAGGSAAVNNAGAKTTDNGTTWTVPVTTAVEGAVNVSIAPSPGITRAPVSVTVYKMRSVKLADGTTELETRLGQLGTGSAGNPTQVALHSSVDLSADWALVNSMVEDAQKYITLDLSACTAPGNTITGAYAPTGNDFNIIKSNQYIVGIKLPAGLESVGAEAFRECQYIKSVDFSACLSTLTSTGMYAFSGSGLAGTLDLSSTNITTIASNTFKECLGITGLVLPAGLISMSGTDIFADCANLAGSITIPEGLTGTNPIGSRCFKDTGISEVVWPAGLASCGAATNVFQNCPLVKITMMGNNTDPKTNFFKTHSEASNAFKNVYAADKAEGAQGVAGVYERTQTSPGVFTAWVRTSTF